MLLYIIGYVFYNKYLKSTKNRLASYYVNLRVYNFSEMLSVKTIILHLIK